jgi:ABC-type branched-subunit amino acid transport system substrate-binding protein
VTRGFDRRRRAPRPAVAVIAGLIVLTGCGGGGAAKPPIATGPGVTASTIGIGILTDLTGPQAALGSTITIGAQLFWQRQNAGGGVCGRTVSLIVKDDQGNPQAAATQYADLRPRVLALQQLLGGTEISGLLGDLSRDRMLALPVSWSSSLLSSPDLVIAGATYDLEMINGIDWLMRTRGLRAGDTVGTIALDGSDGDDAVRGITAAAAANRLTVVTQRIQSTDKDLTAQVQVMRASRARYVLMATTPLQTASAVSVAQAQGYDVTFVGVHTTFMPALLDGPARTAMESRLVVVQPFSPFSGDGPGATLVRGEYDTAYPDRPVVNAGIDYGYAQGEIMYRILRAACAAGSLQRPALLGAVQRLAAVDTGGLTAPLDYSRRDQPPARATMVLRPDATARGGLSVVEPLVASPTALTYSCPC